MHFKEYHPIFIKDVIKQRLNMQSARLGSTRGRQNIRSGAEGTTYKKLTCPLFIFQSNEVHGPPDFHLLLFRWVKRAQNHF